MLPPGPGASEARAAQKSALAGFVHEASTSDSLGRLIKKLESAAASSSDPSALDEWALANLREASRDFARASAIPKELAQRKAALESSAYASWLEARSKSDFSIFAPALKEWIELCKQVACAIDPKAPVYDVLLDEFEGEKGLKKLKVFFSFLFSGSFLSLGASNEGKKVQISFPFLLLPPPSPFQFSPPFPVGATEKRVLEVFECVKAGVVPLRKEILEKGKKIPSSPSFGRGRTTFDPKVQAKLCEEIALDLGFDLEKGRLDVSVHPFTGGACPADVRMTTRFKAEDLLEGITGTTHETGE